ncbi:cyclic nucleotide-binding-like protein [Chytriomyces sp. MP71]|nr:cyclic nucleotide-binding-like protein [Chytriomyces sp. MP71]
MSSPPSTSDSLPSPRFSRATKFESKSLSVIADHDSSRDSLIRDLKNQVKRVTQERDALLEYVKGVNDMSFPLFASFPRNTMEKIDRVVYDMTRKKGQVILTKGEEASEIYFIRRGIVSIFMDGKELTTLTKPAFFGELGVLFKFKRTATVVAKTDVIMIVITKQKLDEIISNSPYIQGMVDEFSNNKEIWWLRQQYVSEQEKFGAEFANDIARKNIRKLDVFTDAPDSFIDTLAMKMACMVVQPQDNIISINEDSDAIYFLVTGTVEVVGPTGIVHAEIQSGSFFGEVGVMLNMKRTASIRAKGQCSVFQLTKENLFKTVSLYPSMHDKIQEAAAERFTLFKSRSEKKEEDNRLRS